MVFDPKNIQILLVEDTAVMRKIEIKTLKSLGFDGIVEAVDGDQAIGILQGDRKVDLIISDRNMPNKAIIPRRDLWWPSLWGPKRSLRERPTCSS
jgi:CheY-like chemotaxis protein